MQSNIDSVINNANDALDFNFRFFPISSTPVNLEDANAYN